ncbi:MAG: HAMP domain-containing sensor histidine kinase [Rhodocyclaceae bacterium]|jgi:two-component system sensor histidine kinase GlrK
MRRLSFRLTLLLGFLLVALLLGAAALRGLLVLEGFAAQSRSSAAMAVQVTADIQQLAERSIDLERSARQFLVLRDPALRERFSAILGEAWPLLERLPQAEAPEIAAAAAAWRQAAEAATVALQAGKGEATLAALAQLGSQNGLLADSGRQWIDGHSARLLRELEDNRNTLLVQVLSAIAAALAIGAALGWWLVRPVGRLEAAIEQLGSSRFDQPIDIRGPVDLQRLGRRLDWLRLRLVELEADRVRVLRHVSHELKTPLAALREGVALLQEEVVGPLTADQREVAGILEHNARALQRQIEDLLNYHATVFDAGHLQRRRIVVRDVLLAVVDEQRLQLQARSLQVRVDAGGQPVLLDPDKLRVALANLLSNAIAYSPPGMEIRLAATVANGVLVIDCIDAGPGVAEEDRERIFEPFVQGCRRPAAGLPGSGVGLSIVRELVAAQGGGVRLVASAQGAHFRMELPYEQ